MRVALVTHYYPAHRGGVELVAAEIAKRLARRKGMEVSWFASNCDRPPVIPGVTCVASPACNAAERRLGIPYPLWSPAALRRVAKAARGADIVHLHDCLYLPNLVAYAAARLARRPVVVTQHVGMVPYRNRAVRALLFAAYRVLGPLVLGGATQVVFVSDAVRRYFERFVRFRSPPMLVFNGVDTAVFHPVDEAQRMAIRAQLGAAPGAQLLLFVGRFVEKKGLPVLGQLARQFPRARWVFAGWGPLDPAHWSLPNVTVMRDRSGQELASLYQTADLLVLPSAGEGFPLVVQEAMACGTPALVGTETAAACPGTDDLLFSEDIGGRDVALRWERRIRALLADPSVLANARAQVAAYARANWSWERCAERYAEILRRCTAH